MNRVILSGNLTRDPEVRYSKDGKPYARVGIAVNRPYAKEKTTDFFTFVAWDKTAEICGNYLKKGSRIIAEGRLQTNSYEKDGVKVNTVDIVVDNVEFADNKRQSDDDNNYSSRKSSGNDYQRSNYSNRREQQAPPRRKNNDFDDFGGEPIDPEDTPF